MICKERILYPLVHLKAKMIFYAKNKNRSPRKGW